MTDDFKYSVGTRVMHRGWSGDYYVTCRYRHGVTNYYAIRPKRYYDKYGLDRREAVLNGLYTGERDIEVLESSILTCAEAFLEGLQGS